MARHIHLDLFNGIAGDMFLAALLHLGAPTEQVEGALNETRLPGVDRVRLSPRTDCAFDVQGLNLGIVLEPFPTRDCTGASEIQQWIDDTPWSERTKSRALRALRAMTDAESSARGIPAERVRFHELGGFDTFVDLAGTAVALELLGVDSATVSPFPLARGAIQASEGVSPSPARATLELLKGFPVVGLDLEGEVVTLTGAALATTLASPSPAPSMILEGTGVGFGRSRYPGRPNCLRLYMGTRTDPEPPPPEVRREALRVLEANIDDLPGEVLGTLIDACLQAGARDAWLTPVLMKKGRPANVLRALCTEESTWPVEEAVFRHSSTLGIRRVSVERDALPREWVEAGTPWGPVRVKIARLRGEIVNRAPEFEDCRKRAAAAGVPLKEVYAAALAGLGRF